MFVKGFQTLAGMALQQVAGPPPASTRPGKLGASDQPILVEFGGWEEATHPYASFQRADAYRIRAYCLRVFVYKCAYWDGTAWTLPTPAGIFRVVNAGGQTDWGTGRPFETHAWTYPPPEGKWVEGIEATYLQDDSSNGSGSFTLSGSRIWALADDTHGDCLAVLIPPKAHHDLIIVGTSYKRVAKKSTGPKDVTDANRYLRCYVSACMVTEGL